MTETIPPRPGVSISSPLQCHKAEGRVLCQLLAQVGSWAQENKIHAFTVTWEYDLGLLTVRASPTEEEKAGNC